MKLSNLPVPGLDNNLIKLILSEQHVRPAFYSRPSPRRGNIPTDHYKQTHDGILFGSYNSRHPHLDPVQDIYPPSYTTHRLKRLRPLLPPLITIKRRNIRQIPSIQIPHARGEVTRESQPREIRDQKPPSRLINRASPQIGEIGIDSQQRDDVHGGEDGTAQAEE